MPYNPDKLYQNMKVIENVYGQLCSFEWLYDSYIEARRGKRYRPEVMHFTDDLEGNLFSIMEELEAETYTGGRYHRFFVKEPKLRLVMSIPFRDRVVQWGIYRIMNPFYDSLFIDDSYACRIGKGKDAAVARLQYWLNQVSRKPGKWYAYKIDISKYFYRVHHGVLLEILSVRIKDESLYNLLEKIINNPEENFGLPTGKRPEETPLNEWLSDRGMPIGNLTSQLFANIYLNELDHFCKDVLHIHYYIRYMDDIIILLDDKEKIAELRVQIEGFISEKLLMEINNKTTVRPCSQGVSFCGQRIYADYTKLNKRTATRMKHGVKYLSAGLATGAVPREYFDRVCASYNGLLVHCDSYGLRRKLNEIYLQEISAGEPRMDKIEIIRRLLAHIVDLEFYIRGNGRKTLLEIEGEIDRTRIECARYVEFDDELIN